MRTRSRPSVMFLRCEVLPVAAPDKLRGRHLDPAAGLSGLWGTRPTIGPAADFPAASLMD